MAKRKCYVYVIKDGATPLYVGKGTGRRGSVSAKEHNGELHILEDGMSDDSAFKAERKWIAELQPTNNISPGGNGGRTRKKRAAPRCKVEAEIDRVGGQVYAARLLLTKLAEHNCEEWGVSKLDLGRLKEVAHG